MGSFQIFAQPWWVNLLFLLPFIAYYFWRKQGLKLTKEQLLWTALFGIAFGFVEAAVVVYLRAAIGLLPGYDGTLADVAKRSSIMYQHADILAALPKSLFVVETIREAATMLMLIGVAFLAAKKKQERWAIYLWTFAFWDIFYYGWLYLIVRWPSSLLASDVLFLIPVPWIARVWFPLLISGLMIGVVLLTRKD